MIESILNSSTIIFAEMMTHPALFTHSQPKKIVILNDHEQTILNEALKHKAPTEVRHDIPHHDKRVMNHQDTKEPEVAPHKPVDIIINPSTINKASAQEWLNLLHKDGILVQQSVSPFEITELKSLARLLYETGFSDLQLLSFPQPGFNTGWRSVFMALKTGVFRRVREKIIFNKSFTTDYYNFDIHKAATVLPEFLRMQKIF